MNSEIYTTVTNDYCPDKKEISPEMIFAKYFVNTKKQSKTIGCVGAYKSVFPTTFSDKKHFSQKIMTWPKSLKVRLHDARSNEVTQPNHQQNQHNIPQAISRAKVFEQIKSYNQI